MGGLYQAVLYKGLEHMRSFVATGVLEPIPHGCLGMTVLLADFMKVWFSSSDNEESL